MNTVYEFVRGDTSPQMSITLARESGDAVDITGATVYLHITPIGLSESILTKSGDITDGPNGVFVVVWSEGDLDLDQGSYNAEIEVVTESYRETVYDTLRLNIRDDFA